MFEIPNTVWDSYIAVTAALSSASLSDTSSATPRAKLHIEGKEARCQHYNEHRRLKNVTRHYVWNRVTAPAIAIYRYMYPCVYTMLHGAL